ncbi:N-isopropylammelide isopropyl amidohydrolase [Austwickia sp. TVS 96-490-7B]|uniref:amidohydrolase family protein n=1 Tax=Austwickia sp. TVS 96-490-7B TaxID=2830843 RepID=UPI001C594223|nr:amidohydrolase family protein [Austwickia sp. TVS 96-490-7B]MBW3086748.1 N-isopropylammelide isopropyl amidohydrolase [Austwickia sp. TVS 96-490-7B]
MTDLMITDALLTADGPLHDILIDSDRITAVLPAGMTRQDGFHQVIAAQGRLVVPGFVDPHIHLDVALSGNVARPGRPQPFTDVRTLNAAVEERRTSFDHDDIVRRVMATVRMAVQHGTTVLRTQCHLDTVVGTRHLDAVLDARDRLGDLATVQVVAFPQQGFHRHAGTIELFREVLADHPDLVVGGAPVFDPGVDAREHIDTAYALATECDRDLDFHADMGLTPAPGSPGPELDSLEITHIARRAVQHGWQGRVAVGHAAMLGCATPEVAAQAIDEIVAADLAVIAQPDLFRLGRTDVRDVRRGLTRVKELWAAGARVTFASNNVQDAFRPVGSCDMLQEALVLSYGAHMDAVAELDALLTMCTTMAARVVGLRGHEVAAGGRADLVVLDATNPSAAVVGQVDRVAVISAGRLRVQTRRDVLWVDGIAPCPVER